MTTDILPTGRLLVTPIFLWGGCSLSLLEGASRVALALHYARCGTPLGVIMILLHTLDGREVFNKKWPERAGGSQVSIFSN